MLGRALLELDFRIEVCHAAKRAPNTCKAQEVILYICGMKFSACIFNSFLRITFSNHERNYVTTFINNAIN